MRESGERHVPGGFRGCWGRLGEKARRRKPEEPKAVGSRFRALEREGWYLREQYKELERRKRGTEKRDCSLLEAKQHCLRGIAQA